jgi:anti-sigma B factor antagonist
MSEIPAKTAVAFDLTTSSVIHERDRLTVRLVGELDGAAAVELDGVCAQLAVAAHVVVDLSEVTFVDSMGLRTLVTWHRSVSAAGGQLVLAGPRPAITRLLATTGLDGVFAITETGTDQAPLDPPASNLPTANSPAADRS